jgi:hypothetical protein
MMRARPRAPQTDRESAASGVILIDSARIISAKPGTSRSITSRVASGVTSLGERPVPPVVTIKLAVPSSAYCMIRAEIIFRSSGRISAATISALIVCNSATTAGPERSSRSPRDAESLMVSITALILCSVIDLILHSVAWLNVLRSSAVREGVAKVYRLIASDST